MELLLALLIVSFAALILVGAVASAVRVNFRMERTLGLKTSQVVEFGPPRITDSFVQLQDEDGTTLAQIPITVTEEREGHAYYE